MVIFPLLVFPVQCHVRCSTLVGSCLACKYWTSMEVNGNGKHSSLIRYGNNYDCKIFIVQASGASGGIQPLDLRIIELSILPLCYIFTRLFCTSYDYLFKLLIIKF
jgi:hypothetical protein